VLHFVIFGTVCYISSITLPATPAVYTKRI
jgi:hypothetical protein